MYICKLKTNKGVLERERMQGRIVEETWQDVEGGEAQV